MLRFVAAGGLLGCVIGGAVGFQYRGVEKNTPTDLQSRSTTDLESSLEKLKSLSSPAGREVCSSLHSLLLQVSSAVDCIAASENKETTREMIQLVQQGCTRTGIARQHLDKLFTLERNRSGSLDEFSIYRSIIESELDGYSSSLNNFLTKNLLNMTKE